LLRANEGPLDKSAAETAAGASRAILVGEASGTEGFEVVEDEFSLPTTGFEKKSVGKSG
jgi:hypothetical protein